MWSETDWMDLVCISTTTFSVLVNGVTQGYFQHGRYDKKTPKPSYLRNGHGLVSHSLEKAAKSDFISGFEARLD